MQRAVRQRRVSLGRQLPRLCPTAQRRMIGDGYLKSHKIEHRIHEPFALAQPHSEHTAQGQGRFDGKIGIAGLTTSRFSPWCMPSGQCFRRHPQCKTATPTQACLVLRPIRHHEVHLCDVMTTIGVVFVRHGTRIKLIAILFAYRRTVQKLFMHQSRWCLNGWQIQGC